jgi:MoaA/NifB/PqqE/SkfB family radical SAM enzyme
VKITAKRLRLALRSPDNFIFSVRHFLRSTSIGQLDRLFLDGYAFRPSLISVNITNRCNLRCAMCMQPRGESGDDASDTLCAGGGELSPEQWCAIVDQAASARPAFYFSGGEPLLYKGIDTILERVKKNGSMAAIVTNGTALGHFAERLVAIGIDNVTLSLDGPESVHDKIRGVEGTFQRALSGLRALSEARSHAGTLFPTLKINCVITPDSLPTLPETYAIAQELGVSEFNLQHPIFDTAENVALHNRVFTRSLGDDAPDVSKHAGEFYPMPFSESDFEQLHDTIRRMEISTKSGSSPKIMFFPIVPRKNWHDYYLNLHAPFPNRCSNPWTTMRLLADGTFEPCLHYVVGNVSQTPIWNLWNAPRMQQFRRVLKNNGLFPACARCCYRCY